MPSQTHWSGCFPYSTVFTNPISLAFKINYQSPFLLNLLPKILPPSFPLCLSLQKHTYLLLERKAWQCAGVNSQLLPYGSWVANLGHQTWYIIHGTISAIRKTHLFKSLYWHLWLNKEGKGGGQNNASVVLSVFPHLPKCELVPATTSGGCSCHHVFLIIMAF